MYYCRVCECTDSRTSWLTCLCAVGYSDLSVCVTEPLPDRKIRHYLKTDNLFLKYVSDLPTISIFYFIMVHLKLWISNTHRAGVKCTLIE